MKSGKNIEFLICQLIDGELPEPQAQALRERIDAEPALDELYRQYASLQGELDALADEGMPEADWDLQRETIRQVMERQALLEPPGHSWRIRLLRWTAAAAAAVVLAAGGLWIAGLLGRGAAELDVAWTGPTEPSVGARQVSQAELSHARASESTGELFVRYVAGAAGDSASRRAGYAVRPAAPAGTIVISTASAGGPRDASATLLGEI